MHDVAPPTAPTVFQYGGGSPEHHARFQRYAAELRDAKRIAEDWWKGLIETETARIGDEAQATINVNLRRRYGPVVDPNVIRTIRSAWLDCQSINESVPVTRRVAPEAFVLLWLDDTGLRDLAGFVATLPFWPMGLDDAGRWI